MIFLATLLASATVVLDPRTESCITAVHAGGSAALQACAKLAAPMVQLWGSKEPLAPELCPEARSIGEIIGGLGPTSGATWNSNMRRQFDERVATCRNPEPVKHAPTLKIPQL